MSTTNTAITTVDRQLQVFSNPEFGDVRVIDNNGDPWFVGKDVAEKLGYTNPQKAIRDHVDTEDKRTERIVHPSGGAQETIIINEGGLYSLTVRSNLPGAKKFTRWLTHDVAVSIRKTGSYSSTTAVQQRPLKTLDAVKEEIALVESTENDTTLKLQEVEKATAALIKANFALKMAKQDYSLALSNYKEAAAIAGVKPKDFKIESPTFTVRYLYEKYKDQGVTISALYDAAIAAGVPAKGVFDRGRLEVPQDHLESVLSSLSLVADQSLSYLKRIEQGLISQDTTLGTLISLLKEEGYTTVDQDSVTAAGLLRVMKKHKLSFKESSHRKGDTIMSSTVPPQTVIDLLSLAN